MTRRHIVLGVVLAAGIVGAVAAQQPPIGSIEKMAANLYRIPGQGGATAVYLAANGVVLVDTKLANNGQAILERVKSVTDKPITMIVNTHTHGDHVGSNMFFPANVEIVAHENTKANIEKMPVYQDAANKNGMPDRTYKDRLSLLSGNDTIDLYYFGPAHTNGDTFVVFRNLRVMHAGDVFANTAQPLIDVNNGGSGLTYGETIGKAASAIKNVDTVITGHTDVKKWQDFVDFGEFNRVFLQHARMSLKAGKSAEQAMMDFQSTLPAKFKGYTLTGGRGGPGGNFNVIYQELQKGGAR
jgi:glyoxylase-like metal-dependent hydrolase (beta-lactamase superfamily II)